VSQSDFRDDFLPASSSYLHLTLGHSRASETIDGRKYNDEENTSEDMRRIKRDFAHNHAMAIHLNLIGMVATVWYGFALASKIRFVL
jgi:hypothetical protein